MNNAHEIEQEILAKGKDHHGAGSQRLAMNHVAPAFAVAILTGALTFAGMRMNLKIVQVEHRQFVTELQRSHDRILDKLRTELQRKNEDAECPP